MCLIRGEQATITTTRRISRFLLRVGKILLWRKNNLHEKNSNLFGLQGGKKNTATNFLQMPDIGTRSERVKWGKSQKIPRNGWFSRDSTGQQQQTWGIAALPYVGNSRFFCSFNGWFFGICWVGWNHPATPAFCSFQRLHFVPFVVQGFLGFCFTIFTKKCQSNWIQVRKRFQLETFPTASIPKPINRPSGKIKKLQDAGGIFHS